MSKIRKWIENKFSGHLTVGKWTFYGFNAMHCAVNVKSKRYGYICFRLPVKCFGHQWGWYFYVSPDATPSSATFAIGSGMGRQEKRAAKLRRIVLGHNFDTDGYMSHPHTFIDLPLYLDRWCRFEREKFQSEYEAYLDENSI